MKRCTKCQEEKPVEDFRVRSIARDGRSSWCKPCLSKMAKEKYLAGGKERVARNKKVLLEQRQKFIADYLSKNPCPCGEDDILVLEFDHREKRENLCVTQLYAASLERLMNEIGKCDVLCANCHKRRTAKDQNSWRLQFLGVA